MTRTYNSSDALDDLSQDIELDTDDTATQAEISDEQLMLRYREGDMSAFDAVYDRYRGSMYRYLSRQLPAQQETVNELFQDIWLKLIKSRENYRVVSSFKTYLYHIAQNTLVDFYRRAQVRQIMSADNDIEAVDSQASIDDKLHTDQQIQQLLAALQQLPHDQRDVFLLKEESNLSTVQIAEVMQVSVETVKSRLRYAVNKLRQAIEES